jgi:hypothetical protein
MRLDDGRIACDAPACDVVSDRATFKASGGVIINHTSFFLTRDIKHACNPDCAQVVIGELAHDLVAFGVGREQLDTVH